MGKSQLRNLKGKYPRQSVSRRDIAHKKDIEMLAAVIKMRINNKLAELAEQSRRAGEPMPDEVVICFTCDEMQEAHNLSISSVNALKLSNLVRKWADF